MSEYPLTPIHTWLERCTGLAGPALTREALFDWQLAELRAVLRYARENSRFYAETLRDIGIDGLRDRAGLARLPRCTAADLVRDPMAFLCVPPREVARITTLMTSGSTGPVKRVFFSERDLQVIVNFFAWGMSCLADESDTVLILMPSQTEWSIGDVLRKGLIKMGASYVEHGPVSDYPAALKAARGATCMVGIPSQVYRMAKLDSTLRPRSVLLSADYVPASVVRLIEENWQTEVFMHYGITEAGFAAGVECHAHEGYHLRDADILYEVTDPETGFPVPAGTTGEVVLTTLNREAMPLIRYRTGDMAVMLPERCPCGAVAPRLGKIQGRFQNVLTLQSGETVSIHALDEAVFALEPVLDYAAELVHGAEGETLRLSLLTRGAWEEEEIRHAVHEQVGVSCPIELRAGEGFFTKGTIKRGIKTL